VTPSVAVPDDTNPSNATERRIVTDSRWKMNDPSQLSPETSLICYITIIIIIIIIITRAKSRLVNADIPLLILTANTPVYKAAVRLKHTKIVSDTHAHTHPDRCPLIQRKTVINQRCGVHVCPLASLRQLINLSSVHTLLAISYWRAADATTLRGLTR